MRTRPGRLSSYVAVAIVGAVLFAVGCSTAEDGSSGGSEAVTVGPGDSGPVESSPDGAPTTGTATDDSTPDSTSGNATSGVEPQGFTTVQARVTAADGEVCEVCLWLADSDEERGRGLMGVTDLGAAAGMVFVFDSPTSGPFYMFQTPTPLSIAWFDEGGRWVGAAEMEPCLDETPAQCALYSPGGASYRLGVEVFAGDLESLLLIDGSVIELLDGTEQLECQTPSP